MMALAGGILVVQWQASLPPAPGVVGIVSTLVALAALRAHRSARRGKALLVLLKLAACACAGFGYAAWRAETRLADALPAQWEGEDVVLRGVIDAMPDVGEQSVRFPFAVEAVDTPGARVPRRVSLAWYAQDADALRARREDRDAPVRPPSERTAEPAERPAAEVPRVHAGERWRLTVRLQRPHGNVNPAGFDLEAWLLAHDLRATGHVRPTAEPVRLDAFAGRASDYVERARERIRDRILAALPGASYAGVLAALTVGDQRSIPEAQWRVFNRTGISHLVSISGLHVTVFAALAGGVARAALSRSASLTSRCPARKPAALIGCAAALGYVLLAGAEVPAVRTLAMLGVAGLGLAVGRRGTGRTIWLTALAVVLVLDPWASLAPGFWLSFGAVGILIYACSARLSVHPRSWWLRAAAALGEAVRTQRAVTIGLVPLSLALFGQLSIVGPLANAIAIPVVTFAVVPLALLGIVVPGDVVWQLAHAVLAALMQALEPMAAWPASAWQQHAPLAWTVGVGAAAVLLLLAPVGVPGRLLGVAGLAPLALVTPPAPPYGSFSLLALDVGQGLAVVVRTQAHALLYDTGPRYSELADAGGRIVAPYLRAAGLPSLSAMVVSHRDTDHSGGALTLLQTVPVEWLASSLADDHPIVVRQRERGSATRCVAGQTWSWDGVRFQMLHPAPDDYGTPALRSNDLSCVLRVDAGRVSALLTGDIEARSEYRLVADRPEALAADVLIVPHHGSRTSSTPPFVEAVAARWAIFTAGYRNRFGHPRADIVERYERRGVAWSRTDRDGAVRVDATEDSLRIEHERTRAPRYWRTEIERDPRPP